MKYRTIHPKVRDDTALLLLRILYGTAEPQNPHSSVLLPGAEMTRMGPLGNYRH